MRLRLAHLYPKLMNIYGDRGNIICLRRRCEARGIEFEVTELDVGAPLTRPPTTWRSSAGRRTASSAASRTTCGT